ncbi:MAG: hypothetical protein HQ567_17660 [Candidatus Nealsonbacteria bacterium]|nr:hypothetical protein [Candidatus Nealsonbacteria bacterium]
MMPRFLHEDDALLSRVIERWKRTAADEVDDIGGWRPTTDNPPDPIPDHVYGRLVSGQGWDQPPKFYTDTTYLVGRVTAQYAKLDPAPLQEIYSAVTAWHEDHNARRIPGQAVLAAALDKAVMTLQAIEADIQERVICEDGRHLIPRLLAATEPPKLFGDDLVRLRAYLKTPMDLSRPQAEPAERENRRKLQEILVFNEQTQSGSEETPQPPGGEESTDPATEQKPTRKKKSTNKGEARAKIISALTHHHQYKKDGSCLNDDPIGVKELARKAEVSPGSVTPFFDKEFAEPGEKGGHTKYKAVCRDITLLVASLKALNADFSPWQLYGGSPPDPKPTRGQGRKPKGSDQRDK